MSVYFSPVLTFDDGPRELYAPNDSGADLGAAVCDDQASTRVAYAYLREAPRPTRWVADESVLSEHLEEMWFKKYGPKFRAGGLTRADIPDTTTEFPIIINHDKREWVDSGEFDFCPLPLLTASFGTDSVSGNTLAGRWFGDNVSVSTRHDAELSEMRQIHADEPKIPGVPADDQLLQLYPDLAAVAEFVRRARHRRYNETYDDWLAETQALTGTEFKGTWITDPETSIRVSAWIKHSVTAEGHVALNWAAGPGCVEHSPGIVNELPIDGAVDSEQVGIEVIEGAWTYILDAPSAANPGLSPISGREGTRL